MIYLAVVCGFALGVTIGFSGYVIGRLMVTLEREREAWQKERRELWQRLQSPEHAVVAHYNEQQTFDSPPAVNPELDEDHWTSKEDLAELAAREELSDGR